ncbi:MAG: DNA polymerase III subunit delta [Selenomonadaceae bacterium]|nr:DNA polymerase III subunit delta [Selenomonadaceae bacterium]
MKFKEFMGALDGRLKNVYLLSGTENYFIDKALEKIFSRLEIDKTTELLTIDCDAKPAISEIITAIDSSPFFGAKNVVLVKNATIFSADKKSERLERILKDMQSTNYAIFTAKAADKRRRLYKIISQEGLILEAEPLRAWEIDDWLNEKLKAIGKIMRGEARRYFNEQIGVLPQISLWHLENEFEKVVLNVTGEEITAADLKKNLLSPPEVSDFALTEAIDARQAQKSIYLLRTQAKNFSKIPLMTALLANHLRRLLRAKFFMAHGISGRRLGESLEMNPYIAQKVGETAKTYSEKILEEVYVELAEADFKLKTGRAGVEALEKIILKLCKR